MITCIASLKLSKITGCKAYAVNDTNDKSLIIHKQKFLSSIFCQPVTSPETSQPALGSKSVSTHPKTIIRLEVGQDDICWESDEDQKSEEAKDSQQLPKDQVPPETSKEHLIDIHQESKTSTEEQKLLVDLYDDMDNLSDEVNNLISKPITLCCSYLGL